MTERNILLIVSGGMTASDTPDLIRHLRAQNFGVQVVLTEAAKQFVTPLTAAALTGKDVLCDTFDLIQEVHINHIALSRNADLVLVAPATADLMARMAAGMANDLATAALLATEKPVLLAPNMGSSMWDNPATQRNVATLKGDGKYFVGPRTTARGTGAMSSPEDILAAIEDVLKASK